MVTKRPSFLKRQKELKRAARALEKREARRERKEAKAKDHSASPEPDLPVADVGQDGDPEP